MQELNVHAGSSRPISQSLQSGLKQYFSLPGLCMLAFILLIGIPAATPSWRIAVIDGIPAASEFRYPEPDLFRLSAFWGAEQIFSLHAYNRKSDFQYLFDWEPIRINPGIANSIRFLLLTPAFHLRDKVIEQSSGKFPGNQLVRNQ